MLIRIRGVGFRERRTADVPQRQLDRIDTCWAAALGLSLVDPIYGCAFHARHLMMVLRVGEPYRVALALAMEIGHCSVAGGRSQRRVSKLLRTTTHLAERIDHPHALAMATLMAGTAAWLTGRWRDASEMAEQSEEILRDRCTGVAWELSTSHVFSLAAAVWMGRLERHRERFPTLMEEAHRRGDQYALTTLPLLTYSYVTKLADDRPDLARAELSQAIAGWSQKGCHLQHYWRVFGEVETALYCGDGPSAWKLLNEQWPAIARSMLHRIQTIRVFSHHLRARCLLALAHSADADPLHHQRMARLLRQVERESRKITRESMPWTSPLACLALAGACSRRGEQAREMQLLQQAVKSFDSVNMDLYAAAARRRLGAVLGGVEGRALISRADDWMSAQSIKNPLRMTEMLAPGFEDRD